MLSNKSKYLLKILLILITFTFAVYSLLLCYVFRIKTPKLFGVILLSLRRALSIAAYMRSEALSIVLHFSQVKFNKGTKSMLFFL